MKTRIILTVLTLILISLPTLASGGIPPGKISLELEEVPIVAVLNMIATQNGLNVIVSGDVTGNVTMRLDNVDVETALDALLTANGYNYFMKDDIVVVKPAEINAAGELDSRVITLKYLDPITAQKALDTRISEKGKVIILDKSSETATGGQSYSANRLLITDFPNILDELVALVTELDVEERTILIEAKIIETTVDSKSNLGINWPTSVSAKISGADDGSSTTTDTQSDNTEENNSGIYDPSNGRWTWGKLSVGELSMVLNALAQAGNSKLVSDPRITTLENHEAEFKFETIIPVQTINRFTEGAATSDIVTFEDEEVGISLRVTARINEGGKITMDVHPTVEDIIGYAGPADSQKPITSSRSIKTRITVNDGETVALGGLLKETDIETTQKVPLLGDIPLLGKLFSSKKTEKTSTDLLILITPHILK